MIPAKANYLLTMAPELEQEALELELEAFYCAN